MLEYGENPEHLQNGCIEMKITIFAASGLKFDDPYLDDELTDSGRQRVTWTVQVFKCESCTRMRVRACISVNHSSTDPRTHFATGYAQSSLLQRSN